MVTLKNDGLTVEIETFGAQLKSVIKNGENLIWDRNPEFWKESAPLLFPICGGLKDDKFTYQGREYSLLKHGFAKRNDFSVEKQTETSAVFLLKSNEETLKSYPWEFELRVKYELKNSALKVGYEVKNLTDDTMYMSVGAHEAYACPEGIEDYDIIFEREETLNSCNLDGNLISHNTTPIIKNSKYLPLYYKYFKVDALVFKDLKSRFATLRNRKTGKSISLDFNGFDYFLLWTKPNAGYICLEPWTGVPASVDAGYDITEKEGITLVMPKSKFNVTHTIYF